ncbi:hypothetical protein ACTFRP_28145 [Bacillus cereus group sp. MYBK234-1]|uniref:hypothetical protein n=1 Tax=unclassified Bacillus cereus group TaxID=2750818 RepID=UPI002DBD2967|nr:hypothetical protein [Bacillus cereus]MEB8992098.1 hypothetical protein [Bacillus cereus]MEB9180140.1 hypothetical protein [Bacillus cereus]
MNIVATFYFVSGLRRATIVNAENIEKASNLINTKFFQGVGHAIFEVEMKGSIDGFEGINDKVEKFEVFRDQVMFIDYHVK